MDRHPKNDELLLSTMLEIAALIALLDRNGLLSKSEVLAEIKSLRRQLTERTGELSDHQELFLQRYMKDKNENTIVDRILELIHAMGLTAHQGKRLLQRVRVLMELGERITPKTSH